LGLLVFIIRRSANASGQAMNFGKSRARFQMEAKTGIEFNDVAGVDEAKEDLEEVVTFLKQPEKFTAIGAKIPKGVLLIGPPGTGKLYWLKRSQERQETFFQHLRVGIRGDVCRGWCVASARFVPKSPGKCPLFGFYR